MVLFLLVFSDWRFSSFSPFFKCSTKLREQCSNSPKYFCLDLIIVSFLLYLLSVCDLEDLAVSCKHVDALALMLHLLFLNNILCYLWYHRQSVTSQVIPIVHNLQYPVHNHISLCCSKNDFSSNSPFSPLNRDPIRVHVHIVLVLPFYFSFRDREVSPLVSRSLDLSQ